MHNNCIAYIGKNQPYQVQKYSEKEADKNTTLQQTSKYKNTFIATEMNFHSA